MNSRESVSGTSHLHELQRHIRATLEACPLACLSIRFPYSSPGFVSQSSDPHCPHTRVCPSQAFISSFVLLILCSPHIHLQVPEQISCCCPTAITPAGIHPAYLTCCLVVSPRHCARASHPPVTTVVPQARWAYPCQHPVYWFTTQQTLVS